MKYIYNIGLFLLLLTMIACRGGKSQQNVVANLEEQPKAQPAAVFIPALAPSTMSSGQKILYMNEHYWDKFDFADTLFLDRVDTLNMLRAYSVYAIGYVPDSLRRESMHRLMQKASSSKRMFDYFMMLGSEVLHNPNSQLRDDELYIPVLEAAIASPLMDEYEKMPLVYDLQMAMQNRIGRVANDFSYTLASGRSGRMSEIKSDYTMIFFSNPGCPMCRDIKEQIIQSPKLSDMISRKELSVLVVYPDADLEAWREHIEDYPRSWINAYDKGEVISRQRLYDLKAIPALYLLDAEKRVMVKDCTSVEKIEEVLLMQD